jgi:hypothetical protein
MAKDPKYTDVITRIHTPHCWPIANTIRVYDDVLLSDQNTIRGGTLDYTSLHEMMTVEWISFALQIAHNVFVELALHMLDTQTLIMPSDLIQESKLYNTVMDKIKGDILRD